MAFARELVTVLGPAAALAIDGSVAQTFSCAGATQATATAITNVKTYITTCTAAAAGAILPGSMNVGDEGVICNSTSATAIIYPPTGYKLNGRTANYPLNLAANSSCRFTCVDGNNYMITL